MTAYLTRRLLFGFFIVWGVYTLSFFLVNWIPGDPFTTSLANPKTNPAHVERLRERWGYDRPVHERYWIQLRGLFWSRSETQTVETPSFRLEVSGSQSGNVVRISRIREDAPELAEIVTRDAERTSLYAVSEDTARRLPAGRYTCEGVEVSIPAERLSAGGFGLDLGFSAVRSAPVTELLAAPLVNTLLLASTALFLDFALGILLGVFSARRAGSRLDRGLSFSTLVVYSLPSFWLALVLVFLLGVRWRLLPTGGINTPGLDWRSSIEGAVDALRHLALPAFVLGVGGAAATARFQRASLLEALRQDFIRTARAKGLSERVIVWRHAFRNSLTPTVTLLGLSLPVLVSGSVIVESIFSWPGMGRELVGAVRGRDDLLVTAIALISTVCVVAGQLVADVLQAICDPRVRLS